MVSYTTLFFCMAGTFVATMVLFGLINMGRR